jgi:Holin of 3TMs, for gene-transfer release
MWELILAPIFKIIDKVVPDPMEAARQKQAVLELQQKGELLELETRYRAIIAEATSTDPWTSRARPSFMYVFYAVILVLGVIAPILGILNPEAMSIFYTNVAAGFKAIPGEMWTTFTIGYVGYSVSRSYEKGKGVAK